MLSLEDSDNFEGLLFDESIDGNGSSRTCADHSDTRDFTSHS
jgi:hypothetical protein